MSAQKPVRGPGTLRSTELKRLHRQWRRSTDLRLGLVLDGVQNPYNVGALLRSAAAYNVETVWLVPPTPGPDHPGVAKTALGSDRFTPCRTPSSGPEALSEARDKGMATVAIELAAGAEPLFSLQLGRAVCLVLGHESRGVHRDTLRHVDHVAFLPQLGKVGSLNVAQAGAIAFYEAARQEWARTPDHWPGA
jgi:tRNA (guanosine-2'-O-)-methyltransferase